VQIGIPIALEIPPVEVLVMDQGVFLNLFEISVPSQPIPVMVREWERPELPLDALRRQLMPVRMFASSETQKLYAYGSEIEHAATCGFTPGEFQADNDPRFMGRLIVESVSCYLSEKHGFEPQQRFYLRRLRSCEVTYTSKPLQQVEKSIDVYASYRIQSLFLKIAGHLRFFLLVNPKVRYRFVPSITRIHARVDCTGKYVRIVCPVACNVYDCLLHEYRGKLGGKFAGLTTEAEFQCRFLTQPTNEKQQYVQLDASARFDFPIPVSVCELEASVSNLASIFSARFNASRATSIVSELAITAGDLLPGTPRPFVNTEVGQRRWTDVLGLIRYLDTPISLFGEPEITISQEPVHAIEGGFVPDNLFTGDDEEEDAEEHTDDSDDEIF
jgi:hypothetical protein